MQPEVLALLAAVGWGANGVLVRKGAHYSSVSSALLLSFLATVCFLWGMSWWVFPTGFLRSPAIFYFAVGGLIQPALVRSLHYTGIVRLGASRAEPLRSVAPLFASIIALLVFREKPGPVVYAAIILTIAGIALISYRREGEARWRNADLCFPLAAALLAAVTQNIRKAGLLILPNPYVGAAMTTTTSLLVFLLIVSASKGVGSLRLNRQSLPFYGAAAIFSAASQLLSFAALSRGQVSVVVTLTSTSPLFTVLFSSLFLKDLEKVTPLVGVGATILVVGVVLIVSR